MKIDFEMHSSLIFLLFLLAIAETTRASETCYFPNGNEILSTSTNTTYEPCNEIAGSISQCCAGNQGCSANGLCVNDEGQYSRGGCTDSTFDTPYCISLCSTILSGGSPSSSFPVHQCTDGTWCCGAEPTGNSTTSSCCANNQGVSLSTTIDIDQGDASVMYNTAKVSIGCGIAAAIFISAGVVGFLTWRKQRAGKMEMRAQKEILSPTRSEHGFLPFWKKNGEVVTVPRSARLSA